MSSRRWELMSGNITDVHPSPVSVRASRSSTLQAISGNRQQPATRSRVTETRIGQSLADIETVISSDVTTPTSVYPSKVYTDSSINELAPSTHDTTAMISLMDESDNLRDVHVYPMTTVDLTTLNLTTNFTTIGGNDDGSFVHNRTQFDGSISGGGGGRDGARRGPSVNLSNDPIILAGDELLRSFHHNLSNHPSTGQILDLLSILSEACTLQIHQLKKVFKSNRLSETISELCLERDTLQLAEALYSDRLGGALEDEGDGLIDMEVAEGRTDKMIVDKYYEKDRDVREAQMVVDWLETISANNLEEFPSKVKYFADSVSWENTVHDIQHGINKGRIVAEVDPDAPLRQNKSLSELDESDEQSLCKHLFKHIRAGQLEKAQDLCIQCGQSWRAATLDGWKLHHDPNLHKGIGDELEPIEGNCRRDLWKKCCWEMTKCSSYIPHERAMYAALCGNLPQLLPVCQSWYDWAWAYFKVMVDVLVQQRLVSCHSTADEALEKLPEEYWNAILIPDLIFQEIEASSSDIVQKQSNKMYHQVQKCLILGDLEALVNLLHSYLDKYSTSLHHLRFMVHIVLFIMTVGTSYEKSKCNDILKAFVQMLIVQQYNDLVALYTSFLPPDDQVKCYSHLLRGVVKAEDQKKCLKLAHAAGLNVAQITKTVVENMRIESMEEEEPSYDHVMNDSVLDVQLTEAEIQKICVLDWLLYDEAHRAEALHQANAMIRIYLAVRKHAAASFVFQKIPTNSPSVIEKRWKAQAGNVPLPQNIENDLLEYCSIRAYLEAIESFNLWFQCFNSDNQAPPPAPPSSDDFTEKVGYENQMKRYQESKEQRKIQLGHLALATEQKIYNVLLFVKKGWMMDSKDEDEEEEDDKDSGRKKQMRLLRQLCIPYVCVLLHTVFHSSKKFKKCLQLADIVASEKHQLYSVFRPGELQHFLSLLTVSSLEQLNMADVDSFGHNIIN